MMSEQDKRTRIIILAASVFLIVVSFSALAYGLQKVNDVAVSNARVICALRQGYVEDRDAAIKQKRQQQDYIVRFPNGATLGDLKLSHDDLVKQLATIQTRIDALNKRLASTNGATC